MWDIDLSVEAQEGQRRGEINCKFSLVPTGCSVRWTFPTGAI